MSALVAAAAVAWYLMLPPTVESRGPDHTGWPVVNASAPMRQWKQAGTFESLAECASSKGFTAAFHQSLVDRTTRELSAAVNAGKEDVILTWQEALRYDRANYEAWSKGLCITSNDQRLRP